MNAISRMYRSTISGKRATRSDARARTYQNKKDKPTSLRPMRATNLTYSLPPLQP